MHRTLLAIAIALCIPALSQAAVIHVPGDQPTIQAGIDAAVSGDMVLVAGGNYTGTGNRDLIIDKEGVTLRSENGPESCIIDCEYDGWGVRFNYPSQGCTLDGITVTHASDGAVLCTNLSGFPGRLLISNCHVISSSDLWGAGGINCDTDSSVTITDCLIAGNWGYRGGGVHCWNADVEMFNCLVWANLATDEQTYPYYGGYGAGIYGDQFAEVRVASTTIVGNFTGETGFGGGILLLEGSTVSIIDSIIWDNDPTQISLIDGSTATVTYSDVQGGYPGVGNMGMDPSFIDGPGGNYYLKQIAAGQALDSPCVDSGSGPAATICYSTPRGPTCMSQLSTRTDEIGDFGMADMGYHYPDLQTVGASFNCTPGSGTLPFSTRMSLELTNRYTGLMRRIAGHLDITMASGQNITNWRAGYSAIAAGNSYTASWDQAIPALGSLLGDNLFTLFSEDVTPAPYNQPPYPSAGDRDGNSCTVTGISP